MALGFSTNDADCDGVLSIDDCDTTSLVTNTNIEDADCDLVITSEDCDGYKSFSTIYNK